MCCSCPGFNMLHLYHQCVTMAGQIYPRHIYSKYCLLLGEPFECDGKIASVVNWEGVEVKCLYSYFFDLWDTRGAAKRRRKIQGVRSVVVSPSNYFLGLNLPPDLWTLRDIRTSKRPIGSSSNVEKNKGQRTVSLYHQYMVVRVVW